MNPNQAIIDSEWQFVLAVTGGGQGIIGDITRHGGMSSTLLEAIVPYSGASFAALVGGPVDHIVSSQASRAAAMACYRRAMKYSSGEKVFGMASSAALAKPDGERYGRKHKVHMTIQDFERTIDMEIAYGGRTRADEEDLTATCIREAIKWGCHIAGDIDRKLSKVARDSFVITTGYGSIQARQLVHGAIDRYQTAWSPTAIFSSSCNPLHDGHFAMLHDASNRLGRPVDVELCIRNADKPPLDYITLNERFAHCQKEFERRMYMGSVIPTNVPLFFDKARLFPGATFVVGSDTFERILSPKYYGSYGAVMEGLLNMSRYDAKFLVYPRKGHTWSDRLVPKEIMSRAAKFTTYLTDFEVPEISSTELRRTHAEA